MEIEEIIQYFERELTDKEKAFVERFHAHFEFYNRDSVNCILQFKSFPCSTYNMFDKKTVTWDHLSMEDIEKIFDKITNNHYINIVFYLSEHGIDVAGCSIGHVYTYNVGIAIYDSGYKLYTYDKRNNFKTNNLEEVVNYIKQLSPILPDKYVYLYKSILPVLNNFIQSGFSIVSYRYIYDEVCVNLYATTEIDVYIYKNLIRITKKNFTIFSCESFEEVRDYLYTLPEVYINTLDHIKAIDRDEEE